jgi:beta-galactosidase GanA
VFVREPGLCDPTWQAAIADRLTGMVHGQSQYHPIFYNLADESGIGDLAAAWDADIGPCSLDGMRTWLRTQYPDLQALNREWETSFARWQDVVPELTDAAMARHDDNYAAWADFKAWMDVAFATAVRHVTDAVHTADPTALAGLEGGQVPGWGGYDYGLLAPAVDVMEVYDVGNAQDLARAFNPGLRLLRTGGGVGPRETHAAWHNLLHGGRGTIVWDDSDDVVRPDGTPTPRGLDIAARVASLRPVAKALSGATPQRDPVAVLYSQASFRTRWMLDHRVLGQAWSGRDAEREYEDNAWRASRRQTLQRLSEIGVEPYFLTPAMVEAGALRNNGLRVLILPQVIAMSQAEAEAITDFAAHGGTVLADTEPGLFDQHSRRRPAPLLASVAKPQWFLWPDGDASAPNNLDALADTLRQAGAPPRVTLRGPDGATAPGVDVQWFVHGDTTILTLQTQVPWGSASEISLHLSQPALVSDLRHPAPAQRTGQVAVHLDPIEPTILMLAPGHG